VSLEDNGKAGEVWKQVDTGKPLIGVGDIGEWDRYNLRLTGAPPIRVGKQALLLLPPHRHTANRHKPYVGKDTTDQAGGLGLATLRLDGFASVAAGFDGGQLTTKPFPLRGERVAGQRQGRFWPVDGRSSRREGTIIPWIHRRRLRADVR